MPMDAFPCASQEAAADTITAQDLQAGWEIESQAYAPRPITSYRNLVDVVRAHAYANSSSLALAWLNKDCTVQTSFTYGQLWHCSGVLAGALREVHQLQTGDRAMIVYPFGIDFLVAFLACMRIGVVVVSVYPPNPRKLAADIPKFAGFVEDSGARIALTTGVYSSTVVGLSKWIHSWPKGLKWIATDTYPSQVPSTPEACAHDVRSGESDLCLLQYTSGSTGNPKGVMISHGNISHQCQMLTRIDVFESWRMVTWCPQYHDMGLFMYLSTLFAGGRAHGLSPLDFLEDPCLWPRAVAKFQAVLTSGPDFSLALSCKRMEEKGLRFDCSALRWMILGAEPTQLHTLLRAVKVWGLRPGALKNSYGLAEHCVMISTRGTAVDGRLPSAGSLSFAAACGIRIAVCVADDESRPGELREMAEGEPGEICVSSASVALGYWEKPEATQAAFHATVDGQGGRRFLRTGDMGYVVGDNLFVTSRVKDVLIVNGRNYAPSDIEKAVEATFGGQLRPGCSAALQGEQAVVLLFEVRPEMHGKGAAVAVDWLSEAVREAAERESGVPVQQVVLLPRGSVPKTTSGKVQRRRAAQLLREGVLAPLSASERGVVTGFEEVESLQELFAVSGVTDWGVSVGHNGLSSLQLMQLVTAAKTRFQIELPYESLMSMTATEVVSAYSSAQTLEQEEWRTVHLPAPPEAQERVHPSLWWRVAVQLLMTSVQLGAMAVAVAPSVAVFESSMDRGSWWWVINGRPGPMVGLGVVLWMASYTAVCILAKWALVGRMRKRVLRAWGVPFVAWLLVERLWGVWEWAVGRFLLSTLWLNVVYAALGSDVALSARLDTFYRCWDLVSIGPGASVKGRLYARVLDEAGVHLGGVQVGAGSRVEAQSVVQAWAVIGEEVVVGAGALVPPSAVLQPAGSRWHGVPCREEGGERGGALWEGEREGRDVEAGSFPGSEKGAGGGGGEPWWATRAGLPLFVLCAVASASATASSLLPPTTFPADAWSLAFAEAVFSLLAVYACTGAVLFVGCVLLKWSFLSPFLTDALCGVTGGSFLPFLDKTLLVNWWHAAFGMRIGRGSKIMLTAACAPSVAHLCEVGARSMLFNAVMAPSASCSLFGWLRGECGAPWAEEADVVLGEGVGLYVLSRVEGGVHMADGAQAAAFARVERGSRVGAGELVVGNPPLRMQASEAGGMGAGAVELSWGQTGLCWALVLGHVGWVAGVVVAAAQAMASVQQGRGGAYVLAGAQLVVGLGVLLGGLGVEVLLFKRVVFGRAREGEVGPGSLRAVLFHHLGYIAKRQEELFDAFFAGTLVIEGYLALLGMDLDVGRVLLNSAFLSAQDADLISVRAGAVVDEFGILSAHNVTLCRILTGKVHLSPGAVMHPFSALFLGSVGESGALLPRSKPLREVHVAAGRAWAGAPAFECVRVSRPPHLQRDSDIISPPVAPGRGGGREAGAEPHSADRTEGSLGSGRADLLLLNASSHSLPLPHDLPDHQQDAAEMREVRGVSDRSASSSGRRAHGGAAISAMGPRSPQPLPVPPRQPRFLPSAPCPAPRAAHVTAEVAISIEPAGVHWQPRSQGAAEA